MSATLTYITAFIDLKENRPSQKNAQNYSSLFGYLVSAGVPIVVFVSPHYIPLLGKNLPAHITIVPQELEDLWTYREVNKYNPTLPTRLNPVKDTKNYLTLMNAKPELVAKGIELNPYKTEHFAWIDIGIFHIIRDIPHAISMIKYIGYTRLRPTLLSIPGCYTKGTMADRFWTDINWRFCGGLFVGDRESLLNLYRFYSSHFSYSLSTLKKLTWEVNFLALLEFEHGFPIEWFEADHNNTILNLPGSCFLTCAVMATKTPSSARKAIDSLLPQVHRMYLYTLSKGEPLPPFLGEEPYKSKVVVQSSRDEGLASKFIAHCSNRENEWIFIADDDRIYASNLIERMRNKATSFQVYQNAKSSDYAPIQSRSGLFMHSFLLRDLSTFPFPDSAREAPDHWMAIYLHSKSVPILHTGIGENEAVLSPLPVIPVNINAIQNAFNVEFHPTAKIRTFLSKFSKAKTGTYDYPTKNGFLPSSASVVIRNGIPYINTRYVNYQIQPDGSYSFSNPHGYHDTQNLLGTLKETLDDFASLPNFTTCDMGNPVNDRKIFGLEDLRLYEFQGRLCFIATQWTHSIDGAGRMAIGDVDVSSNQLQNVQVVYPPVQTYCEKNWIPLTWFSTLRFIYKWYPFQIGHLTGNKLVIDGECATVPSFFNRVRGSTICVKNPHSENMICVVHWSEETVPRTYYHMLVELDRNMAIPIRYSQPFSFFHSGIEFCIGFCFEPLDTSRLRFWVSRTDRDPAWVSLPYLTFTWTTIQK